MCAGDKDCTPGSCPAGQACYNFDDPFDEVAYCVPVQTCTNPPATAAAVRAWELSAQQTASDLREKFRQIKRATKPRPEQGDP